MQRTIYHGEEGGHHDRRPNHQPSEQQHVLPIQMPEDPPVLEGLILQSPLFASVPII